MQNNLSITTIANVMYKVRMVQNEYVINGKLLHAFECLFSQIVQQRVTFSRHNENMHYMITSFHVLFLIAFAACNKLMHHNSFQYLRKLF